VHPKHTASEFDPKRVRGRDYASILLRRPETRRRLPTGISAAAA